MTLKEQIKKDHLDAYKAGIKVKKIALEREKTAIGTSEKDKKNIGREIADEIVMSLVVKEKANFQEVYDNGSKAIKAGQVVRMGMMAESLESMAYLNLYLPTPLSEDEIKAEL